MTDRTAEAMGELIDKQMLRHDWLFRAGAQLRQWQDEERARDRFNDITREAGCSNKAPASN